MTRKWTNKLLERMEEGAIEAQTVAEMCLSYMSEDEVEDMCSVNDLFQDDDQEDE